MAVAVAVDPVLLQTCHKHVNEMYKAPAYNPVRLGMLNKDALKNSKKFTSEYQEMFKVKPYQVPPSIIRPPVSPQRPASAAPIMEMQTMYRETFVPHEIRKRVEEKREVYHKRDEKIEGTTIYQQDFSAKECTRTEPIRPETQYTDPCVKFGGTSEYETAYQHYDEQKTVACRVPTIKPKCSMERHKGKFEDITTVQNDYHLHTDYERVKPIIPESDIKKVELPFDSVSMYKKYYTEKPLAPKPPPNQKPYRQDKTPFQKDTTFRVDYRPHPPTPRQQCFKPPPSEHFKKENEPFEGSTTKGDTYKTWPLTRSDAHNWGRHKEYKRPTGVMILDSTYQKEFRNPGVMKKPPRAHADTSNQNRSIFASSNTSAMRSEDKTTYGSTYRVWNAKPADSSKEVAVYEPPSEKFIALSTQRSHYSGQYSPAAKLCRPRSESWHPGDANERMILRTTYREAFRLWSHPSRTRIKLPQTAKGTVSDEGINLTVEGHACSSKNTASKGSEEVKQAAPVKEKCCKFEE